MTSARNYEALLKAGRWFGALPEDFQRALLDAAVVRKLGKGELLFARGDAPSGLYAVVDGTIRASALGPNGKEILLAMLAAPMWFGEISVLDASRARTMRSPMKKPRSCMFRRARSMPCSRGTLSGGVTSACS